MRWNELNELVDEHGEILCRVRNDLPFQALYRVRFNKLLDGDWYFREFNSDAAARYAVDRYFAEKTGKTVKLRASVCYGDDGSWIVLGTSDDNGRTTEELTKLTMEDNDNPKWKRKIVALHWVDVEVPAPPPMIQKDGHDD